MIKNCTAIILTGGDSTRMGSDKANVLLNGRNLLQQSLSQIKPLFEHVIVSSRESRFNHDEAEILDMTSDCRGPILGIVSSLAHIQTEWAFVIACDMPFAKRNVIQYLCHHRQNQVDAIVPNVGGKAQPLFALYKKQTFVKLLQAAQQGHCSLVRNLYDTLNTYWIEEEQLKKLDPELVSFVDIDTPEELAYYQKNQ
jgi:molybdopterin-guanine dinucleotide biosynthesis protein A